MKLEHSAVYVNDLESMKEFYQEYFGAVANEKYHNPKTGLETYFLSFKNGDSRLELMTRPEMVSQDKALFRTGLTHLAFSTGSESHVDDLTHSLKAAGYTVISGPRRTGDAYYESCILDPEGNQIEITS
ncbi:VOC family protein [Vagococcus salmoninarum]|uniref:VOC family protein n=1 Tax=Vagococcus salmoninarum TaxID=2739 RepID=UPI0018803743|nr:VOC family protein [Vagococcus salmoninarum]MBE9390086.1 VOC family protein [Vagococcus salmoninarum]